MRPETPSRSAALRAALLLPLLAAPLAAAPQEPAAQGPDGVSFEEATKRALIFSAGANKALQKTLNLLLENEIERRELAGMYVAPPVPPEELERELERQQSDFTASNPELDFWDTLRAMGFDRERYLAEMAFYARLDRTFFPPHVDDWSEDLDAIFDKGNPNGLYDTVVAELRREFEQAEKRGRTFEIPDTTKRLFLRPAILRWLLERYPVQVPFHGLPEGVCMRVGGREVKTEDLYQDVLPFTSERERRRAEEWVRTRWAMMDWLQEKGLLLSSEEAWEQIQADKAQYEGSPITFDQVVLQGLGFPSMNTYYEHFRLRSSLRREFPDPWDPGLLEEHLAKRALTLREGMVTVEAILFLAVHPVTGRPLLEGDSFAEARARAEACLARLEKGEDWSTVLEDCEEWPEDPDRSPLPRARNGRLEPMGRVNLRLHLGENRYQEFFLGRSVADEIFYEAEIGEVRGPVEIPRGYLIYKVLDRKEGTREFDLSGANARDTFLVSDDLLDQRFFEVLAEVRG